MAISAEQIKVLSGRVSTATAGIKSNSVNAGTNAGTISNIIKSGNDSTSANLAASWNAISESFNALSKIIDKRGTTLSTALDKWAENSASLETQAASEVGQVQEGLEQTKSYFQD